MGSAEERDGVEAVLDAECSKANALSLTQATQLGATQRVAERGSTRDAIIGLDETTVQRFIASAPVTGSQLKRMGLLLYSLSHVLPTDSTDSILTCRAKLEGYIVAIIDRVVAMGEAELEAQHGTQHGTQLERSMATLTHLITTALSNVGITTLGAIINKCLDAISQRKPATRHVLAFLPVALSQVSSIQTDKEGSGYVVSVEDMVKRLCAVRWPPELAAPIMAAFAAVRLPAAQAQQLADAAVACCERIGLDHLPTAAKQLLLLAANDTGPSIARLHSICAIMTKQEQRAAAQGAASLDKFYGARCELLSQMQPVLARNKALASAWLKEFKRGCEPSRFAVAVTVLLASATHIAPAALDALRFVLAGALKAAENVDASSWLSGLQLPHAARLEALAHALAEVARRGGDALKAPLLSLGRHLALGARLKCVDVSVLTWSESEEYVGLRWWTAEASAQDRLCLAGVAIMEQVVRYHEGCCAQVLEHVGMQCVNADSAAEVLPQLLLLRQLTQAHSHLLESQLAAVEELVAAVLSTQNSVSVLGLQLLWPLCSRHKRLRTLVVAGLHRAQATHSVPARVAAAQGSLLIIIHSIFAGAETVCGETQVNMSQFDPAWGMSECSFRLSQLPGVSSCNGSLLGDFAAFLRRALGQQAAVRQVLYNGLAVVVSAEDGDAEALLHSMLLAHLHQYIDAPQAADGGHTLQLQRLVECSTDSRLVSLRDALPELMTCVRRCAARCSDSDAGPAAAQGAERLAAIWKDIAAQQLGGPDGLGLKPGTSSGRSVAGVKQQMLCYAMLGVLDVVLAEAFETAADAGETELTRCASDTRQLLEHREKVMTWLQGSTRPKSDSGGKKAAAPAAAQSYDLDLVPTEPGSRPTFMSPRAMEICLQAVGMAGPLYEQGQLDPTLEELLWHRDFLLLALGSGEAVMLQLGRWQRANTHLLPAWSPNGEVEVAVEQLLGLPAWRPLMQLLLKSALGTVRVLLSASESDDPPSMSDVEVVVPAAIRCACTLLDVAVTRGAAVEVLASLPELAAEDLRLLQVTSPVELAGEGASEQCTAAVSKGLPNLLWTLRAIVKHEYWKEVELWLKCLAGVRARGGMPQAAAAWMSGWPAVCFLGQGEECVQVSSAAAAVGLVRFTCSGGAQRADDLVAHVVAACKENVVTPGQDHPKITLRVPASVQLQTLSKSLTGLKTVAAVLVEVLHVAAATAQDVQWLAGHLERQQLEAQASPRAVADAVALEAAAAQRIELLAKLLADASTLCAHAPRAGMDTSKLLEAHLAASKDVVKAASLLVRSLIVPKGGKSGPKQPPPPQHVRSAAAAVSHELIQAVYDGLLLGPAAGAEQQDPNKRAKTGGTASKKAPAKTATLARVKRQAAIIPDLVFWIESFDSECLRLSKAAKTVLVRGVKRTVNRDFRIMAPVQPAAS